MLKINGRAAVVVPDNVLFEGGAGETVRRKLLHECDVHTLLRLPTGIFYAQGVKANVLFFDRKPASETPWTKQLWIYDLRTNQNFTLKTEPAEPRRPGRVRGLLPPREPPRAHADLVGGRPRRPLARFTYDELLARDKVNLDIFWLRDESLEDSASLPDPDVLAAEIVEDLQAALEQFRRSPRTSASPSPPRHSPAPRGAVAARPSSAGMLAAARRGQVRTSAGWVRPRRRSSSRGAGMTELHDAARAAVPVLCGQERAGDG